MVIKQTFPIPQETAIASFSFTDIAEGTGVQIFYLTVGQTSSGKIYELLSNAVSSAGEGSDKTITNGFDVDFDTSFFNLPRTVKGTAFISGAFNVDSNNDVSMTATILKFDGSTETIIGATVTSQTENATGIKELSFEMPLTQTLIKKGELLRVTVTVSAVGNSSLLADPLASLGQALTLHMPFKLDL